MNSRWTRFSILAASFALFGFHQENGCGGDAPVECPLVLCDIYCPGGNKLDADGCETCECNPPPPVACEALDEQACLSDSDCEPFYADAVCDAAPCHPDSPECFRAPCTIEFLGCRDANTACQGRDEASCTSDPSCRPIYEDLICDRAPCPPDDPTCFVAPCTSSYVGCTDADPCEGLDEYACLADPACQPHYQDVICAREAAPCPPDDPSCFVAPCDPIFSDCHTAGWCGDPNVHTAPVGD